MKKEMDTLNLINRIESINQLARYYRSRTYKTRIDGFSLPDVHFKGKYLFSKETVRKIINLIKADIEVDRRGCGTTPQLQVLVALRCWGRMECQDDAGDLHGLSQSTVSRICAKVSRALAKHANEFIKMPSSVEEEVELEKGFKAIDNFPGVIGAIDGCQIKIKKTGGDAAQNINRKGLYSLNVQVVCDSQMKILDLEARRSCSRIFNESALKERFENREFQGRLLGDSSYKLTPYLFTPLLHPQNEKELKYNSAHIATRNTVERCFGVWKQRFRFLNDGMTVSFQNAKILVVALAVLHNIAIEENEDFAGDFEASETIQKETIESEEENSGRKENAILRAFIQKYF